MWLPGSCIVQLWMQNVTVSAPLKSLVLINQLEFKWWFQTLTRITFVLFFQNTWYIVHAFWAGYFLVFLHPALVGLSNCIPISSITDETLLIQITFCLLMPGVVIFPTIISCLIYFTFHCLFFYSGQMVFCKQCEII